MGEGPPAFDLVLWCSSLMSSSSELWHSCFQELVGRPFLRYRKFGYVEIALYHPIKKFNSYSGICGCSCFRHASVHGGPCICSNMHSITGVSYVLFPAPISQRPPENKKSTTSGMFHTFEPSPRYWAKLQQTVQVNQDNGIAQSLRKRALSERTPSGQFQSTTDPPVQMKSAPALHRGPAAEPSRAVNSNQPEQEEWKPQHGQSAIEKIRPVEREPPQVEPAPNHSGCEIEEIQPVAPTNPHRKPVRERRRGVVEETWPLKQNPTLLTTESMAVYARWSLQH